MQKLMQGMSAIPHSRTVPRLLEEMAGRYPAQEALVGCGERLTYSELRLRVMRVARRLHTLGIRRQDRVAILMGNRPEWIVSALAIASLGATAVALNTWSSANELEYLLEHSEARLLIACRTYLKHDYQAMLAQLEPLSQRLPRLQAVLGIERDLPPGWLRLHDDGTDSDAATQAAVEQAFAATGPDDVALLLYTSGSTARPKGVPLQHYALIENIWQIGERQHVVAGDRLWLAVSLFWGLGCANALFNLLTHGGCIVLQESFDALEALRLIEREKCTLFYGTPNMANALHAHPDRWQYDLSSLRGGATLGSPEQMLRAMELGSVRLCNMYGLTETYGNSHVTDADDELPRKLETCGRPLPGVTQKIVDPETGAERPCGLVGEIRVKGYVMPGYYKDEALSALSFDGDGFFKTGDLGFVDLQGYLYYRGRLKEMVKTNGMNVAPAEVEAVLMSHPSVHLALCAGRPDPTRDEILVAAIVVKAGHEVSAQALIDYCRGKLAAYKLPRMLRFVSESEVPLTTTGKVQKNRIVAAFFSTGTEQPACSP